MTVLTIRHFPENPVLRQKAKKISRIDGSIQRLIDNMIDTLHQVNGIGLAAPQVGVPLRLIVVQLPGEGPVVIINPEVIERTGEQKVTEGCLSVPGYYGELERSAEVVVRGKDRRGKAVKLKADGLMAEALEHEIDHLDGRLYVDRIDSAYRLHRIEPNKT